MATRPTYVYRLDVLYPEGSNAPGWEPPGWEPDNPEYEEAFRWPAVRLYLSRSGALARAKLLESYGAKVQIVPSCAVDWGVPWTENDDEEPGEPMGYVTCPTCDARMPHVSDEPCGAVQCTESGIHYVCNLRKGHNRLTRGRLHQWEQREPRVAAEDPA